MTNVMPAEPTTKAKLFTAHATSSVDAPTQVRAEPVRFPVTVVPTTADVRTIVPTPA